MHLSRLSAFWRRVRSNKLTPTTKRHHALSNAVRFAAESLESRRLLSAGDLDLTFGGGDGVATLSTQPGSQIDRGFFNAVDGQGRIVVAGTTMADRNPGTPTDILVSRFNADGTPDTTFGGGNAFVTRNVLATDQITDMAVQSDGKIVIAFIAPAPATWGIMRLNVDGTPDTTFDVDGMVSFNFGDGAETISKIALRPDGRIVSVGTVDTTTYTGSPLQYAVVVSLLPNGVLEFGNVAQFNPEGVNQFSDVALDGARVVAMGHTRLPGANQPDRVGIARFDSQGSLDSTFGLNGMQQFSVPATFVTAHSVAVDSTSRVYVAATISTTFNPIAPLPLSVYRLTATGAIDPSFNPVGPVPGRVDLPEVTLAPSDPAEMLVQPFGKLMFGGAMTSSTSTGFQMARLNLDGSLDASFAGDGVATFTPTAPNASIGSDFAFDASYRIVMSGLDVKDVNNDFDLAVVRLDNAITPTADPGGPYTVAEGKSVIISGYRFDQEGGSGSTYEWDLDYDGTTFDVDLVGGSHLLSNLDGPAIRTLALRVTSSGGSDIGTTTLTVTNVAPTVTVSGPSAVNENAPYTINFSATDPGPDTITAWTVNWGDGTIDTLPGNASAATHTFTDGPITPTILVSAMDEDGTFVQTKTDLTLTVDSSFGGGDGLAESGIWANSTATRPELALLADGSYYLVGNHRTIRDAAWYLQRFHSDGSLDLTFGNGTGGVLTDFAPTTVKEGTPRGLSVGPGGRVAVGGDPGSVGRFGVAVYTSSGALDTGFDGDGLIELPTATAGDVTDLAFDGAGRLLVAARLSSGVTTVRRFLSDGQADLAFGTNGVATITSLVGSDDTRIVEVGGNIYVSGYVPSPPTTGRTTAVARLTSAGQMDANYGTGGIATATKLPVSDRTFPQALTVRPDGTVYVGGVNFPNTGDQQRQWFVARFTPAGSIDTTFGGGDGIATFSTYFIADLNAIAIRDDGQIYFGGQRQVTNGATPIEPVIVRLSANGSLDTTFGTSGLYVPAGLYSGVRDLAFDADGHLLALDGNRSVGSSIPTRSVRRFAAQKGLTIAVRNVAPTAAVQTWTGSVNEASSGARIRLNGLADPSPDDTTAGFTFSYDFDGDGVFDVVNSTSNEAIVPTSYYADGPKTLNMKARISDKDGGFTDYLLPMTVLNDAPTATFAADASSVNEGGTNAVRFTQQNDFSVPDTTAGFKFSYDFNNDGTFDISNSTSSSATVPAALLADGPVTRIIRGRIADKDGGFTDYTTSVVVNNVAPGVVVTQSPVNGFEGSVNYFDANTTDVATDLASGLTLAWSVTKNGNPFPGGTAVSQSFSFTPDDQGAYVVKATVTDKDGGSTDFLSPLTIVNVAPTPFIDGGADEPEGAAVFSAVFSTDPSPIDTAAGFTYAWNVTKNGSPFTTGTGSPFLFESDDQGTYLVSVTATDRDGATSAPVFRTITVANANPFGSFVSSASGPVAAGTPVNFTFPEVRDGPADLAAGIRFSYDFNNDGDFIDAGEAADSTSALRSFTFATGGTYTVRGRMKDKDGGFTDYLTSVTVQGAGPTAFQQDSGADGLVVVEAENFDANVGLGGKTWQSYAATSGFSGSGAMRALTNTGANVNTGYVTGSPRLDFRVNFTRTGLHYVWVRGLGLTGDDDTVHVGLDNTAIDTADRIASLPGGTYGWIKSTLDGPVATINVTSVGVHTLNLWMREDGVIVDKLLLTTNANYTPTAQGPAESPRSGGSPSNQAPTVQTIAAANPTSVNAASTILSVLGADDGGEANLVYTWATTGTPPAPVNFSANASNAAKLSTATFTKAGAYNFTVTIRDTAGLTTTSSVAVTVNAVLSSVVVSPVSTTIAPGATQAFSAIARDQFGDTIAGAAFAWTLDAGSAGTVNSAGVYTAPASGSGAASVRATSGALSAKGDVIIQAQTGPAAFQQDGGSDGLVVVEAENNDGNISQGGKSWVSYSAIPGASGSGALQALSNTGANVNTGYTTASPRLDFRVNFTKTGVHYVWVRGYGPTGDDDTVHVGLDNAAIDTADRISSLNGGGYAWIRSTLDGPVATINITTPGLHTINLWMREDGVVVDKILLTTNASFAPTGVGPVESSRSGGSTNAAPTIQTPAAAGPSVVSGTSAILSALGADDAGEGNLVYTWLATGSPPAPIAFSVNGSNAAKSTTATFTKAGSYAFTVTVRDAGGLTITSNVNVTVNQTLTSVTVAPATQTLAPGGIRQFAASASDQFNDPITGLAFTWSVDVGGVGSVNQTGLYTAPASGSGAAIVRATSGGKSGVANVTISAQSGPPAFQQDSGTDGLVVVEAENFDGNVAQGGKTWTSYTATAGFSGTGTMQAGPNTDQIVNAGYTTTSPRLDFRINFTKTGVHYIWARGLGLTGNDDTLHVGLDNVAIATSDRIASMPGGNYGWINGTLDGPVATINVTTPGEHILNLWMREDGVIVDKLLLTTNSAYAPTGQGPAQSVRAVSGTQSLGSQSLLQSAPSATLTGPSTGTRNSAINFVLGAAGLSPADSAARFKWSIDWNGDGVIDQTLTAASGASIAHTFATAGTYTINLFGTREDGTGSLTMASLVLKIT